MERIGLLTCYIDNYGACLQAYALQNNIIDLGYKCDIIQYTPSAPYKVTQGLKGKIFRILKDPLKYIKQRNEYIDKYSFEAMRRKRFFNFKNENLKFSEEVYATIEDLYKNPPNCDSFVCGSDQLWNPVIHNNSNNKAYFLDFAPAGIKRIAYAPSIGLDDIPEHCKPEMAELLNKIDYISVREISGAKIIKELTNKDERVVLDPTLLYNASRWNQILKPVDVKKPYILCYLFGMQEYIGEFVKYVKEKTNFEVVVLPFTQREEKGEYTKIYDAGPSEFLWLIKNAEIILTDSFHATAFSINFNRPFYSMLRNTTDEENNMNSRIYSILEITDLKNRIITNSTKFPEEIDFFIDYEKVNNILNQKRKEDILYLKNALAGKVNE